MKAIMLLALCALPAAAQPIRDVPGTVPAPVPEIAPNSATTPPDQDGTRQRSGSGADVGLPHDRSGGTTDAGPANSTPLSGVPQRGDAASGTSSLGR